MRKIAWPFAAIALLCLALASASYGLVVKGYSIGSLGLERLGTLADPQLLFPLASLYAVAAAMVALLPLRAAGWVHSNISIYLASATIALLSAIIGLAGARAIFISLDTIRDLLDWSLLIGLAVIAVHLGAGALRRNALVRSLACAGLIVAALACLYWSFRI